MADDSLKSKYEKAFQYIETAQTTEKCGDLRGSYNIYMAGIELFLTIYKLEKNEKKKLILKSNLDTFMNKAESIKNEIESSKESTNKSGLQPYNTPGQAPSLPNQPPYNPDAINGNGAPSVTYSFNSNYDFSSFNNENGNEASDANDGLAALNALDDLLPDPPKSKPNSSSNLNGNVSQGGMTGIPSNEGDEPDNDATLEEGQMMLDKAIDFDTNKEYDDAIKFYTLSSQLFLDAIQMNKIDALTKKKTRDKVSTILGRLEILKKVGKSNGKNNNNNNGNGNRGIANEQLSQMELEVLRRSSYVRSIVLYPWMEEDKNSRFKFDELWKDPTGLLPLSDKQKSKFGKWRRISNISNKASIVNIVTPYSITQTLITDCSFVSSMIVTALYEKQFKKGLITNIIFPQNNHCVPIYNDSGKYIVKLFLNGCFRKVEIDDYLPVSKDGRLLCSFSNDKNEFWVSLIEKAFLKVMGGYDFPGSTSCEDLHVLTGWIPERVGFHDNNNNLNVERLFDRLTSGSEYGDCLITVATKEMSENEESELGLVSTHAYAVLKVIRLGNHKFIQIKNPWASKRWKGRFSVNDNESWTPQLQKALDYNPARERLYDNGIFWMDFNDTMKYFAAIYMNWNPDLFNFRIAQHGYWPQNLGPKNDSYNLGYNPQFSLDVEIDGKENGDNRDNKSKFEESVGGTVWILLSKHMANSKREEQDKNDFLTLHVYSEYTSDTIDRRVFYRKGALHNGVYINSPHYLMRIDVNDENEQKAKENSINERKNDKSKQKENFIAYQKKLNRKANRHRYTIVISQYEKKNDVSFTITAYSTIPSIFRPIDDSKIWKYKKVIKGAWTEKFCGGSPNHSTFPNNPQFRITVGDKLHLRFVLEAPVDYSVNVQLYLCINNIDNDDEMKGQMKSEMNENKDENNEQEIDMSKDDNDANGAAISKNDIPRGKIVTREHYSNDLLIADTGAYRYGVAMMDVPLLDEGTYIAIISTFQPKQVGGFKFTMRASKNVGFVPCK